MSHSLPQLPYQYDALEPHIDKTTMFIHHTAHHQTYISKLNDALEKEKIANTDVQSIFQSIKELPTVIRNNGGGHYNHSLFWRWMAPIGSSNTAPFGKLKEAIDSQFGSLDAMRSKFTDAALTRFGSGWAWLGVRPDGTLTISSTPNQDNPLMKGVVETEMIPILGLDVWEHAYYLKYQNKRNEYIQQWWSVVNWDEVVEGYDIFASHGKPVPMLKPTSTI